MQEKPSGFLVSPDSSVEREIAIRLVAHDEESSEGGLGTQLVGDSRERFHAKQRKPIAPHALSLKSHFRDGFTPPMALFDPQFAVFPSDFQLVLPGVVAASALLLSESMIGFANLAGCEKVSDLVG